MEQCDYCNIWENDDRHDNVINVITLNMEITRVTNDDVFDMELSFCLGSPRGYQGDPKFANLGNSWSINLFIILDHEGP